MSKNFLFVLFIFLSSSASAQFSVTVKWAPVNNNADTIYYTPQQKLVWADFKGRPDAASVAAAVTESGFGYRMNMNAVNNKMTVEITVFCYFNKNRSWVKKGMNTGYALLHEQHHYDVTYINACLFVQKLKAAQLNRSNFNYLVEKIHDECFAAMDKMQNDYDGETSNGRIPAVQALWNNKIDRQLAALTTN